MTLENQNKSKKDIKRINPFTIVIGKEGNNKLTEKMKNSKKGSYLKEAHIFLKYKKFVMPCVTVLNALREPANHSLKYV